MSFHTHVVSDIDGKKVDFKNKVIVVTNVASRCGKTAGHYKYMIDMQAKFDKSHKGKFQVVCFPCNQFGGQEPKPEADIKQFVENKFGKNHGLKLMSKINVNGNDAHSVYKWMKSAAAVPDNKITWNFGAYFLLDKAGKYVRCAYKKPPGSLDNEVNALLSGGSISSLKVGEEDGAKSGSASTAAKKSSSKAKKPASKSMKKAAPKKKSGVKKGAVKA